MITPPPLELKKVLNQIFFLDLSAFFSVCNGYFSQTKSFPKLNTLDLSLVQSLIRGKGSKGQGNGLSRDGLSSANAGVIISLKIR